MLPGEGPHVKRRVFRPIAVVDPDGTRPPGLATLADAFLALRLVQVRCACLDPVGVAGKGLDRAGTQARLAVAARADFSVWTDRGGQRGQVAENLLDRRPTAQVTPRDTDHVVAAAEAQQVGILARVPLASGLLTGKLSRASTFAADDHRGFNRHGEMFDKGETFSGVPYDAALDAVDALRALVPAGMTMTQFALRWILMFDAVTCAIPGAKHVQQARDNAAAADLPALSAETMSAVAEIYDTRIRALVHDQW